MSVENRFATYGIIGLGHTGFSCARYFKHKHIPFVVFDSRANPPMLGEFQTYFPDVPIYLGNFDGNLLKQSTRLIISPGISLDHPAIIQAMHAGVSISSDIALFAEVAKAPIIAITGTNGKGTVTTLLSEMLEVSGNRVATGGNIGIPALDLLFQPTPKFYVLEISSFQLETAENLPIFAATILNLTADHLDRHKTMEAYHAIKQRVYQNCEHAVICREDPYSYPIYSVSNMITFGLTLPGEGQFGIREGHLAFGHRLLFPCASLRLTGQHNWLNALAALALGKLAGLAWESMLTTLHAFKGLPHRCEWITHHHGVTWIDDSKGTNVGATLAALEGIGPTLSGKIVLIAGGVGKRADFDLLQAVVARFVRHIIVIGESAKEIQAAVADFVSTTYVTALADAVFLAARIAQPGDVVLLSPACASFDMFTDYMDRGEQFKQLVRECCG